VIEEWLSQIPPIDLATIIKPVAPVLFADVFIWLFVIHIIVIGVAKGGSNQRRLGASYWALLAMSILFLLHFVLVWVWLDKLILVAYR